MDDDGNFNPMETWQSLVQFQDEENGTTFEDLADFCDDPTSGITTFRFPSSEKVRRPTDAQCMKCGGPAGNAGGGTRATGSRPNKYKYFCRDEKCGTRFMQFRDKWPDENGELVKSDLHPPHQSKE